MKGIVLVGLLVLAGGCLGCSTTYHIYQGDMWEGRQLLGRGDYGKAHEHFVKAAKAVPDETYRVCLCGNVELQDERPGGGIAVHRGSGEAG